MTVKHLKHTSLIVQGVYCLACIADVVLCLLYRGYWDTASGRMLADAAGYLTSCLALLPVLPALLALNVYLVVKDKEHRGGWIAWAVTSVLLCVGFCLATTVMFVSSTGGV